MRWFGLGLLSVVVFGAGPLLCWPVMWAIPPHHVFWWWSLAALLPSAPVLVLLALPFARQDPKNIFPAWLQWLNTPDDTGASEGLYEPQVYAIFEAPITLVTWLAKQFPASTSSVPYSIRILQSIGFYLKTWVWLGWRNQMMGLFSSLCPKFYGSLVTVRDVGPLRVYSIPGYSEWTWPMRRVSFGWKVQTLRTAKIGDPIWWVCQPSFWKAREY